MSGIGAVCECLAVLLSQEQAADVLLVLRGFDERGTSCGMPKCGDDRFARCLTPILAMLRGLMAARWRVYMGNDDVGMLLAMGPRVAMTVCRATLACSQLGHLGTAVLGVDLGNGLALRRVFARAFG